MGRKRRYQADPQDIFENKTKGTKPPRKRRKVEHKEEIPDFEKTARNWDLDADSTAKLPTRSQSGKLEKVKSSSTSSDMLKKAQERVKERVHLQEQRQKLEMDGEKKMSAAKQKRKEDARISNQIKEISSTKIDVSKVPDLLRIGWNDAQNNEIGLMNYFQQAKEYIASLASTIIEDPQKNCKILIDLEVVCKFYPKTTIKKNSNGDEVLLKPSAEVSHLFTKIRQLAILSMVAVLKDITPGYRVRGDNDDIRNQPLKKSVRAVRMFEYAVLQSYNRFLDFVEHQVGQKRLVKVCVNGLCGLLDGNYVFNTRERLLKIVIPFMNVEEPDIYKVCVNSIEKLFESDELGEASQEAVRFIMQYIKTKSYNVRPEMVDTLLKLKFTQDLSASLKGGLSGIKQLSKKEYSKLSGNKKKLHRKEKELEKDLMESTAEENKKLMTHYQAEILKSVFSLYFRVLKMEVHTTLLQPVLRGLAKFSHLINLEFQSDLFKALRQLMAREDCSVNTVLQCALTAFQNLQMHGNTLEVDLKDFYERVYESLLDIPKENDCIPNLMECIRLMISNNRHLDISRVAAYVKRLAIISSYLPVNGCLAILITIQRLMQTFPTIKNMLDSVEDKSASRYNPYIHQPDHCKAVNTQLWELVLLESHYHPTVSEKSIATAEKEGTQLIPLDIYKQFDTSLGGFNPAITKPKPHPFEKVIKNAPNSKCYLDCQITSSPLEELIPEENPDEIQSLFANFYNSERNFDAELEKEQLKQKLQHYKSLLKLYLEYDKK